MALTHRLRMSVPLFNGLMVTLREAWDSLQTSRHNFPANTGPIPCLKMTKHYRM